MRRISLARLREWTAGEIAATACLASLILGCILFAFLSLGRYGRTPRPAAEKDSAAAASPALPQAAPAPAKPAPPETVHKPPESKAAAASPDHQNPVLPEIAAVPNPIRDDELVKPQRKEVTIRIGSNFRLLGNGSVVILAPEPAILEELLQQPERLGQLIQSGSLFTVNKGTVAEALEVHGDLIKVKIVQGDMSGRSGWVNGRQIRPESR